MLKYTHGTASGVSPSTFKTKIFSETTWPIKAKCYVKSPCFGGGGGGAKVCSLQLGHMAKMADMPIYG